MFQVGLGTELTQIRTDPEPNQNFKLGFRSVLKGLKPNQT